MRRQFNIVFTNIDHQTVSMCEISVHFLFYILTFQIVSSETSPIAVIKSKIQLCSHARVLTIFVKSPLETFLEKILRICFIKSVFPANFVQIS